MQVILNGTSLEVSEPIFLEELLASYPRWIAVAHNGCVIPRARWADQKIVAGDEIEIIHPVQGG